MLPPTFRQPPRTQTGSQHMATGLDRQKRPRTDGARGEARPLRTTSSSLSSPVTTQIGHADANEGEGVSLLDLDTVIDGIPTRGVVPFRFENSSPDDLDARLGVTVRDSSGNVVAGSSETTWDRLVWRSDDPLDPLTQYEAEIDLVSHTVMVAFTTATDDSAPPFAPSFAPLSLIESFVGDQSVCCEIIPAGNDCTFIDGYQCLPLTFKPAILAISRRLTSGLEERYEALSADSPLRRFLEPDSGATRYCVDLIVRSLLENRTETIPLCADSDEVQPAPFSQEDRMVEDICQGPAVDEETGKPLGDGGCNATGSRSGAPALLLLGLLGLTLLGRRRSRHLD